MHYHKIDLQQYLKNHNTKEPPKEVLQDFENNLSKLLKVNTNESEEHQKIALMDFLKDSFNYERNTKNRIDLSIYEDNKAQVLFEVKSLKNKSEFINANMGGGGVTLFAPEYNLECKAFYESILYFLREHKTYNNNSLKYIILTNTRDFYLIDAREYLTFASDKTILKAFYHCDKNQGTDTSTQKFYTTLKDYLPRLDSTLKFIYFHIQTTPDALLYQVLSPQVLLKQKAYIDANTLNQGFYDELLYILGLQEVSQNSKILILPTTEPNTLLDSICNKLKLDRDKDFEIIFSLLTTWNNRILFLRLLESMLLSFKHIDKPFLDINTLQSFTDLNTLFFDILALKKERRKTDLKLKDSIPYLNSSLFDKTELEKQNKEISRLDSNHLAIFKHSILKKDKDYKDTQSLPLLDYLFTFLHLYDFTTTPKDIINHTKTNYDKLINAAVLGLVFEKLNGYKEGSFYTPSFITSYMCKQSLEKVVIDKFNTAKSWVCDSLESLTLRLDKLTDSINGYKEANTIFDSIKVCDPAVGSGHFLVSMLNAMIELKFRLKILCEISTDELGRRDYKRLKDIDLRLENDEILIQDSNNALHTYQIPAHDKLESHKIQKAIFHNKRILIESCLFGVDINTNSCEITKLRLWIELLKHSFYIFDSNGKNTGTLETLPNIDINIKCGNSLISRFDLQDSLKHIPNIKHQIAKYQKLVFDYKNADQNILNISKQEIEAQIESIKQAFTLELKDPKTKDELEKAIQAHIANYGISLLDNESLLYGLSYTHNIFGSPQLSKEQEDEAYISYGKIVALRKKLDSTTSGESYKNAFEWRFAFPEVLDSHGDFLGFDLVIGNPPYIDYRDINKNTLNKTKYYTINKDSNRPNIFCYFIERGIDILTQNGILTFINPIAMLQANFAYGTRKLLLKKGCIDYIADCSYIKVFNSASTYTMMWAFSKNKAQDSINVVLWQDNQFKYSHNIGSYLENEQYAINVSKTKINFKKSDYTTLGEIGTLKWGTSQSGYGKKKITMENFLALNTKNKKDYKPIIQTADIKRYFIDWQKEYIPTEIYSQSIQNDFNKPKIVIARMTKKIQASFDTKKFYMGKATLIVDLRLNPYYILAVLNSKLANFWYLYYFGTTHLASGYVRYDIPYLKRLPIPQITESNKPLCDEITALVEQILESKAKDSATDTTALESAIDQLVYTLYNLSDEEIQIIEAKS